MESVFICGGTRTPIGSYGKSLASIRPDDLAARVIQALVKAQPAFEPSAIDDVIFGCANQAGEDNRNVARMAALLAGLPETVPGVTVNRLCASGLDAVAMGARHIMTGQASLIIAGGVESMSRAPFVIPKAAAAFTRANNIFDTTIGWRFVNPQIESAYGIDSMPETAENVAESFNISRQDQDEFALRSQQRAAKAIDAGRFKQEIIPIEIKTRKAETIIVDQDEHPRQTSLEKLAQLPTPFRKNGTVTAGNASGVNDGAAALLLANEKAIKEFDLTPLARIERASTAGVSPRLMGIGPVPAIEKLLAQDKASIDDFALIELNEAFASQSLAVLRQLGLADDAPYVNPNGGAIALGHPLGMSGARLALTAS
ncbi:MAG: 3-oxoadipyl-CoA thiolase, partial [Alphaproteobacteria bacterium]|nr:3-oxoadipyl-CoA thiolase [Alphaproteobacteria bacterium]